MKKLLAAALAVLMFVAPAGALEIVRQKNAATYLAFPMILASDDVSYDTTCTSADSEIDTWTDGAAPDGFTDCTNEITQIGSTGIWYLSLSATEMNNDYIAIKVTCSTANTQTILIRTTVADPLLYAATDDGGVINVTTGAIDTVNAATLANGAHGGSSASFAFGAGGSISSSSGTALTISSSGGNGHGVSISGNGTGEGLTATGGASGAGIAAIGGATAGGYGLYAEANSASTYGIYALGKGATESGGIKGVAQTSGEGIEGLAAGNGHGLYVVGAGSGEGIHATAGAAANGHGAHFEGVGANSSGLVLSRGGAGGDDLNFANNDVTVANVTTVGTVTNGVTLANGVTHGGSTASMTLGRGLSITGYSGAAVTISGGGNGEGVKITAPGGNWDGIYASGSGNGSGANFIAGSGGNGLKAQGGSINGHGVQFSAPTLGFGMYVYGAGTGVGARFIGGEGGGSGPHGIEFVKGIGSTADDIHLNTPSTNLSAHVADAVWDEAIGDHGGAGSTGEALADAAAAGDPWVTPLPGSYTSGQAGYVLGNLLADILADLSEAHGPGPWVK